LLSIYITPLVFEKPLPNFSSMLLGCLSLSSPTPLYESFAFGSVSPLKVCCFVLGHLHWLSPLQHLEQFNPTTSREVPVQLSQERYHFSNGTLGHCIMFHCLMIDHLYVISRGFYCIVLEIRICKISDPNPVSVSLIFQPMFNAQTQIYNSQLNSAENKFQN
jgi:hypothetical protein